jgi:oligoendopeptidase F
MPLHFTCEREERCSLGRAVVAFPDNCFDQLLFTAFSHSAFRKSDTLAVSEPTAAKLNALVASLAAF